MLGQLFFQSRQGRYGFEKVHRQYGVQKARPLAELFRQQWRAAHDLGDQLKQLGVRMQHGEKLNAGGQAR